MLEVTAIPCLKDNYAYAVRREGSSDVVVVDACEERPIQEFLVSHGLRLVAILSTHHHHDHVGGNLILSSRYGAPIYGYAGERSRIPGLSRLLVDDEAFDLLGHEWKALHVPGHTSGALCYVVEARAFTGDTLFVGGCGRLFEGTPSQMRASLGRIGALGEETILYTGHEYAESNLRFGAHILPADAAIRGRLEAIVSARARGHVMAVTTVRAERETNLFLRTSEVSLRAALGLEDACSDDDVLGELRRRKNDF